MSRSPQPYRVAGSDDENVYLEHVYGLFKTRKVSVPKSQVAAVEKSLIDYQVRTTGGVTYRVQQGYLPAQREILREAFAQWGVQ